MNAYRFNPQELEAVISIFKKSKRYNSIFLFTIGLFLTIIMFLLILSESGTNIYISLIIYSAIIIALFYLGVVVLGKNIKQLCHGNYECILTVFSNKRIHTFRGGKSFFINTNDFNSEVKSINEKHGECADYNDEIIVLKIQNRRYAVLKRLL